MVSSLIARETAIATMTGEKMLTTPADLTTVAGRRAWARRVLPLLDLTDLAEKSSSADVLALCEAARDRHGSVAAVCVWPRHVAQSCELLAGSTVKVATVVNFPSGAAAVGEVLAEADVAVADGAQEIDLVLPWRAFLAGDEPGSAATVESVRRLIGPHRVLKVILETGLYPDQAAVGRAARLAIAAGADFLKTSTGKAAVSATPEAVATLLSVIRTAERPVGIKPSGGIRSLQDAVRFLAMADDVMGRNWASPSTFRFGASHLHAELLEVLDGGDGAPTRAAGG
jgi:deoxyribose-phosphate aldolase